MSEFIESVKIIKNQASPQNSRDWSVLTVHAPRTAQHVRPGHFVQIQCEISRSVIPIMLANNKSGSVDLLCHAANSNNLSLFKKKPGDTLNLISPIKKAFEYNENYPRPLLICEGQGIAPILFLASKLHSNKSCKPFVIMESETTFPFRAMPSQFMIPGIPDGITAAMPLLEDWNIPSRLVTTQNFPGCFDGNMTDLVQLWIEAQPTDQLNQIEIFICASEPMLGKIIQLCEKYRLPCQTSPSHT